MLAKKSHLKVRVLHMKLILQSLLWAYKFLSVWFSLWEKVGKYLSKSSRAQRILKSFCSCWLRKKCLIWKKFGYRKFPHFKTKSKTVDQVQAHLNSMSSHLPSSQHSSGAGHCYCTGSKLKGKWMAHVQTMYCLSIAGKVLFPSSWILDEKSWSWKLRPKFLSRLCVLLTVCWTRQTWAFVSHKGREAILLYHLAQENSCHF